MALESSRRTALLESQRRRPPRVARREARARSGLYPSIVKPALDRFGAFVLLLALGPLMLAVAAVVLAHFGRPVLFRQRRVGLDGRVFEVIKFRSMLPDRRRRAQPIAHADRRVNHKSSQDPRHTPLGRFLRRSCLDELPQLLNVLKGDMSIIGPRPELELLVKRYEPWQHRRHQVRPGITGLWQVTARRDSEGEMHRYTEVDLRYVKRVSLLTDLWILALTLPAVFGLYLGAGPPRLAELHVSASESTLTQRFAGPA